MSKIYIACGLTHIPRQFFSDYSNNIHKLAAKLEKSGHTVKYALKHSDPQLSEVEKHLKPELCYLWDKNMVEEAQCIVAEASFPSIGLGIELQIAANKLIPIIFLHKDYSINIAEGVKYTNPDGATHKLQISDGKISLMALGLPNVYSIHHYDSLTDISQDIADDIINMCLRNPIEHGNKVRKSTHYSSKKAVNRTKKTPEPQN